MNRIFLCDVNNQKISPELVRYFKYQNDYYLIYTFHEIDEKGFMTLYVVKVMEELGQPIARNLSNDWEWQNMQVVVKQMLREIKRDQILSFEDVDINTIQGIKVTGARSFKLLSSLVQVLSGEYVETPNSELGVQTLVETKQEDQKKVVDNSSELTVNDKIQILNQLKKENPYDIEEKKYCKMDEDLNLSSITPIVENTMLEEIEDTFSTTNIFENLGESIVNIEDYQRLKEENEILKQQLLQYQIKYQAIKDLLLKDE